MHNDKEIINEILAEMVAAIGSLAKIQRELPLELRRALDEIIDTGRTGRVWVKELEKTEKTYIGTKVEIIVRAYFAFPKGRLDLRIAHHDVDIKNTVGKTWMIPPEAMGAPCLLLAENDQKSVCSAGLLVARPEVLTRGENQDKKRSVSAKGRKQIHWLFQEAEMPYFWSTVDPALIRRIMDPKAGGTERLRRLFETIQQRPVTREIIKAVARQKDYMKRLRRNGGAKDPLREQGVAVLGGKYDKHLIQTFDLPACTNDEYISFRPSKAQWQEIERHEDA